MKEIELTQHDLYGLKVTSFTQAELLSHLSAIVQNNSKVVCYGYSLGTLYHFYEYPEIYGYTNSFDIMVTDGTVFYFLCRLAGIPLKINLSIPQLVLLTLAFADRYKLKIMLLGAGQEINEKATQNLRVKYKNAKIADGINGYFSKESEKAIVNRINLEKTNILLIGMTYPLKEKFTYEWKDALNVNIIIPCGGMIDVLSEKTKVAPAVIKKLGLASLFRIAQEPSRMFKKYMKLYAVILFFFFPRYIWNVLIIKNQNFSIPALFKCNI